MEELLNKFDNTNTCKEHKVDSYLKTQDSYVDLIGNFGHIMCQFIIEQKDICASTIQNVNKKKLSVSKTIETTERTNILICPRK